MTKWKWLILLSSLCLFACTSIETRIKENRQYFNSLERAEQNTILRGEIAAGFTPTMVYIAWGNPDAQDYMRTPEGEEYVIWIYTQTYGEPVHYYRRHYNPKKKRYHYHPHTEVEWYEYAKKFAIFEDGEVVEYGYYPGRPLFRGPVGAFHHPYANHPNCRNKSFGYAQLYSYHHGYW